MNDKEVEKLIKEELQRQKNYINLIPSENYASEDILKASGSIFTNKYAEGYPNKRYYPGVAVVDKLEKLAIERAKKLFNCEFANVQPLTGSVANLAIYNALLNQHDKVLAMKLDQGGHLSHGSSVSLTGKIYDFFHYGVNKDTEIIDYDQIRHMALIIKPKLIIGGASNYSKIIDWKKLREIADEVGAYLMADTSHISALIVTGLHPNPFPYAHVQMTTLQKQIRGARGAIILSNDEKIAKKIDSSVFPGIQGGPQENLIAAKAVTFYEAMQPNFKEYCKNIIENAKAMCNEFIEAGYHVVSNGTDNHLFCVDVYKKSGITAEIIEKWLEDAHILANKNTIPYETNSPRTPSGIRIGSPAMTTRGLDVTEFVQIAKWIIEIIESKGNLDIINKIKNEVSILLNKYPIYENLEIN